MSQRDWKESELFGGPDDERYSHECPDEYALDQLDDMVPRSPMSTEDMIAWMRREEVVIDVAGYKRASLASDLITQGAGWGADATIDCWADESVLDPEDFQGTEQMRDALMQAYLAAAVRLLRDRGGPWHCEYVVMHTYQTEELVSLMLGNSGRCAVDDWMAANQDLIADHAGDVIAIDPARGIVAAAPTLETVYLTVESLGLVNEVTLHSVPRDLAKGQEDGQPKEEEGR